VDARLYSGGVEQTTPITFTLSGADENAYSYTYDDYSVTVTCFGYSETPLTIRAAAGAQAQNISVKLEGP
jgi:hypothetical protein